MTDHTEVSESVDVNLSIEAIAREALEETRRIEVEGEKYRKMPGPVIAPEIPASRSW
jgi:hypothetical protein